MGASSPQWTTASVGHQDYNTGFNVDMSSSASNEFSLLNLEGAKGGGGGGVNLRTGSDPFGTFKVLSITYGSNQADNLYVNGMLEGNRFGGGVPVSLNDLRVGARYYDNGGGPFETGYLDGDIPELMIYDSLLTDTQRQAIENGLIIKYIGTPTPGPDSVLTILLGAVPGTAVLLRRRRNR